MDDDFKKMMKKLGESNLSLMMERFEDEVKTKYISRSAQKVVALHRNFVTNSALSR